MKRSNLNIIVRISFLCFFCLFLIFTINKLYEIDFERKYCGTEYFLKNNGKQNTKEIFKQISIDCKEFDEKYNKWICIFYLDILLIVCMLVRGLYKRKTILS